MPRTKKEYLFIDGYNVINQWKHLKNYTDSIENSRNKLIEELTEYRAYKGINIVIVFDGHLVKGNNESKEHISGLDVVYTKEHETADSYIEKQLNNLGRTEIVQVATDDNSIQQIVIARGGTRMSTSELLQEFEKTKQEIRRKTNKVKQNSTNLSHVLDKCTLDKLEKLRRMMD